MRSMMQTVLNVCFVSYLRVDYIASMIDIAVSICDCRVWLENVIEFNNCLKYGSGLLSGEG